MINKLHRVCKICPNTVKWDYSNKRWRIYCSQQCAVLDKPSQREKQKQTNLIKYGVETSTKNKSVVARQRLTNIRKYGKPSFLCTNEGRAKTMQTMLEKYGVEYSGQSQIKKEKTKQTWLEKYNTENVFVNKEVRAKTVQTMLEKYGVEYSGQSQIKKEKTKQTWLEKYDGHPHQTTHIRNKFEQTCLSKYGANNPRKSNIVKDKIKQTWLEKYGGHPHQQHMISILPLIEDYNWLYNQYIILGKTSRIIAEELDISSTTILRYLHFHEIDIKEYYWFSFKCITWLNEIMETEHIYIQHAQNMGEFKIPETNYRADGYCAETNTIYEFYGDFWHGNPDTYDPGFYNHIVHDTMGNIYQNTIKREHRIKALGFNLVVMWEDQFDLRGANHNKHNN